MLENLDLFRLGAGVQRFHTWPTLRQQSVGEHSHAVAMLVLLIEPEASGTLLRASLMHDISECVTGDAPATVKWRYPEIKKALKDATMEFENEFGIRFELSEQEQHILSWCDMTEMVFWALEEMRMGNRNADKLVRNGTDKLLEMGCPNRAAKTVLGFAQDRFSKYKCGIFSNDGE